MRRGVIWSSSGSALIKRWKPPLGSLLLMLRSSRFWWGKMIMEMFKFGWGSFYRRRRSLKEQNLSWGRCIWKAEIIIHQRIWCWCGMKLTKWIKLWDCRLKIFRTQWSSCWSSKSKKGFLEILIKSKEVNWMRIKWERLVRKTLYLRTQQGIYSISLVRKAAQAINRFDNILNNNPFNIL